MAITKVSHTQFNKAGWNIATGAGNYNLPREDVDSLYGPGWPVQPVNRPEDSELPRSIDYPVGINYTLQPRIGYAGLMPAAALKAAYTNVSEVAMPVNIIIREMGGFMPILRDPITKQKVKQGHPYSWMTISPDRDLPFNAWLAKYKKSAKIYAAPAFYMKRESGSVVAMEYIDGSTFFLIVNSRGNLPNPNEVDDEITKFAQRMKYALTNGDSRVMSSMPEIARNFVTKQQERVRAGKPMVTTTPAFTQIIKGVPFSFWDKNQVYFIPEPPAPAVDSPYGESYIERAWTWINIIATLTAFELGHYRTGNMPEGLMVVPKEMFPSMGKIATGERESNARMADGSQVQHARVRWMPEGTSYIPTKKPDFPTDLYTQAKHNILLAIGMPSSEVGDKPSKGLGGKGFEQGAANEVTRQLLEIEKENVEDAFNYVLAKDGVDDAQFYLDYPQEQIDPSQQQEDLWNKFSRGVSSLNDVLTEQGKQPIGDANDKENVANMHLIVAGTTIFVVEKMQPDESGIIATKALTPNFGGSPNNPEDQLIGDKKGIPPQRSAIRAVAKAIEESGGKLGSTVTYSLPLAKIHYVDETVADNDPILCPPDCDPDEYAAGLIEEQEHADTVGNDQNIIAQIVIDHLKEDPQYYTHLREAGLVEKRDTVEDILLYATTMKNAIFYQETDDLQKHCGVCPEDSEYAYAPIVHDNALAISPDRHHANGVEVVSMIPKGRDPVLALWKPAGQEKDALNESLGGVQYVREEAAWLLDQSLGFNLVPLSYVGETPEGEEGAVIWYTVGNTKRMEAKDYAPEWTEKAAIFDYLITQLDRRGKNYLTHPDDPKRMILIDNGYSMPVDKKRHPNTKSDFATLMIDKPLSEDNLNAIHKTMGDLSMWQDMEDLIGKAATDNVKECAQELLNNKMMRLEA